MYYVIISALIVVFIAGYYVGRNQKDEDIFYK